MELPHFSSRTGAIMALWKDTNSGTLYRTIVSAAPIPSKPRFLTGSLKRPMWHRWPRNVSPPAVKEGAGA